MSKIHELISIEPPEYMSSSKIEHFQSKIHTCPICYGHGGYWHDQHTIEGEGWNICKMCQGTGQIQAKITQEWIPAGEVKEQFIKM